MCRGRFLPIKINRKKMQLFNQANKRILRSNTNKVVKIIKINCKIIGRFLAISIRNRKLIDFERATKYSLAPIPLSICNLDGTMRRTSVSVLMKWLMIQNPYKVIKIKGTSQFCQLFTKRRKQRENGSDFDI